MSIREYDKALFEMDLAKISSTLATLLEKHRRNPELMTDVSRSFVNQIFDKIVRLDNRSH